MTAVEALVTIGAVAFIVALSLPGLFLLYMLALGLYDDFIR